MKLPVSCLIYWLKKTFPQAKCSVPDPGKETACGRQYAYPVFSDAAAESGHVVIVRSAQSLDAQCVPEDSFLVIFDDALPEGAGYSGPYIALGSPSLTLSMGYNVVMSVYERFDRLQEKLRLSVEDELSYQAIIDDMEDVTDGAALFLLNASFHVIALCGRAREEVRAYVDEHNHLTPEYLYRQLTDRSFQEAWSLTVPYPFDGLGQGQCRNIYLYHSLVGRLVIPCGRDPMICAYYSAILEIGAAYIERICRRTGGFHSHRDSTFDARAYLSRLLNGEYVSREEIQICRSSLGWEEDALLRLVLFRKGNALSGSFSPEIIAEQIHAGIRGAVCLPWEDGLLLLQRLERSGARPVVPQWLRQLLATFSLKAGASRTFSDIHHIRTALRQAQAAIEMGRIYSPSLRFYLFDDYSYHYLLRNGRAGFSAYDIGDPALRILDEYDRRHETNLSLTLYTYLRLHCSATAAARALYIARGSLLKRIARIRELTGIDFDDFWRYSYLLFSYSLRIAQEKAMAEAGPRDLLPPTS